MVEDVAASGNRKTLVKKFLNSESRATSHETGGTQGLQELLCNLITYNKIS